MNSDGPPYSIQLTIIIIMVVFIVSHMSLMFCNTFNFYTRQWRYRISQLQRNQIGQHTHIVKLAGKNLLHFHLILPSKQMGNKN